MSVFERVRECRLKFSREKSRRRQEQINFLGHIISWKGVKPGLSKVEAIKKMKIPQDVKGIWRLLLTLHHYRRFIPEMAEYLIPLNNLLKKGMKVTVAPVMEDNIRNWRSEF